MALVPPALGPESNQHREEGLQGCGWSNIRKAHTQLGKSPIPKDPSGNDRSKVTENRLDLETKQKQVLRQRGVLLLQ